MLKTRLSILIYLIEASLCSTPPWYSDEHAAFQNHLDSKFGDSSYSLAEVNVLPHPTISAAHLATLRLQLLSGESHFIGLFHRPSVFQNTTINLEYELDSDAFSVSNFGEQCIFAAVSAFRGREKSDLTSEGTLNFCNDQTSGHVILDGQDFLLDTKDGSDFGLSKNTVVIYPIPENHQHDVYPGINLAEIINQKKEEKSRVRRDAAYHLSSPTENLVIELMIVVDSAFIKKHRDLYSVKLYLQTILGIMSNIYRDPSLGVKIELRVLDTILMHRDRFRIYQDAEITLRNFCEYQHVYYKRKRLHPADHAIFLTGVDICVGGYRPSCPTLGFANIGGMCDSKGRRSCSISQDSGLATAYTAAHEMGHSFGIMHDGDQNSCFRSQGMLMASKLAGSTSGSIKWSECSRRKLLQFLYSSGSDCLRETSRRSKPITIHQTSSSSSVRLRSLRSIRPQLPGEVYSADEQCRLAYGASSSVCSYAAAGDDLCKYLFCNVADTFYGQKCISMKMPPAEGTSCGRGKWCRQASCVSESGYSSAIDGQWASWGAWSNCPAECGSTGIRVRTRSCSDPAPAFGGLYCRGSGEETKTCMGEACDASYSMFSREDQCKQLQPSYRMRASLLTGASSSASWKPYLTAANYRSCKLQCQSTGDMYDTKVVSTIVADGTSCAKDGASYCYEGQCRRIGCDGAIDGTEVDNCGVCGGDSSSCIRKRFVWLAGSRGREQSLEIPASATNVKISQAVAATSSLQMSSLDNDPSEVDFSGKMAAHVTLAGSEWFYERSIRSKEEISSPGPLSTGVRLISKVHYGQPTFTVSYYVAHDFVEEIKPQIEELFVWREEIGSCSKTCGSGGVKVIKSACFEKKTNLKVTSDHCKEAAPRWRTEQCELEDCPAQAKWAASEWGVCSANCGQGTATRVVSCLRKINGQDVSVSSTHCELQAKPADSQTCEIAPCTAKWTFSNWSRCSARCPAHSSGTVNGEQTRTASCRRIENASILSHSENCRGSRPADETRQCRRRCHGRRGGSASRRQLANWRTGAWSSCSKSCGGGEQRRSVRCRSRRGCHGRKPLSSQACNIQSCPVQSTALPATSTRPARCVDMYQACARIKSSCGSHNFNEICCQTCSST